MSRLDRRTREAIRFTLALWLSGWALQSALMVLSGRAAVSDPELASTFLPVISAIGFSLLIYLLDRRIERLGLAAAWALRLGALAFIVPIQTVIDARILIWASETIAPRLMVEHLNRPENLIHGGLLWFWIFGLNLMLFRASAAAERERASATQLAASREAAHRAELSALRFQINPHLLFNALNAVSTLVLLKRNEEAEDMIDKLAHFLRGTLRSDPEALVPLAEELEAAEIYLGIESVRFGERLATRFVCPPELSGALLPHLLLQPLVENAVKYGVAPSKSPVTIRVEARRDGGDLVVTVVDDGAAAGAAAASGCGVGLTNVRRRLETLYGGRGALDAGPRTPGYAASVRLPFSCAVERDPERSAA